MCCAVMELGGFDRSELELVIANFANLGQVSDMKSDGAASWTSRSSCIALASSSCKSTRPDIDLFKDEKRITLDLLIMSSLSSSITRYASMDPSQREPPLQSRHHPAAGWTSRSAER